MKSIECGASNSLGVGNINSMDFSTKSLLKAAHIDLWFFTVLTVGPSHPTCPQTLSYSFRISSRKVVPGGTPGMSPRDSKSLVGTLIHKGIKIPDSH